MAKISIEDLKPGMKLAKPVINENSLVLYSEGTVVTEAVIERLRARNIAGVFVEGSSRPEQSQEEMLADLQKRFRKTDGEPHMGALKRLLEEHVKELFK